MVGEGGIERRARERERERKRKFEERKGFCGSWRKNCKRR